MATLLAAPLLAGCGSSEDDRSGTASSTSPTSSASSAGSSGAVSGDTPSPVAPSAAEPATRVGSVVPEDPTDVRLPDGVIVAIRAVDSTDNGVLDVPSDIRAAGWWRGGSRLGDPFGSTLVAAHVDSSTQGLGPFADLLTVEVGDRVRLRSEGLEQTFRVSSLRLRPRGDIAADSQLHSPDGRRRLTLVTCAPPYVLSEGGYQNLAVITAEPVGEPAARSGS